jgi:hypothetical protein
MLRSPVTDGKQAGFKFHVRGLPAQFARHSTRLRFCPALLPRCLCSPRKSGRLHLRPMATGAYIQMKPSLQRLPNISKNKSVTTKTGGVASRLWPDRRKNGS